MRQFFCLLAFFIISISLFSQTSNPLLSKDIAAQKKWVDNIYDNMSLEEKVGQLFMVRAFSNQGLAHENTISQLITNYHIGGLIYSTGGPVKQAKLNNLYQATSKTPLLIGMDAEWGLGMRLDSTYSFPWNMTLGAVKNNQLIEQVGRQVGEHCKRIGVHFNFAPVVDINTNPKNPIIGNRSFGEDRDNVTEKSLAFMKGMQDVGVLANAKHFPGHGDTDSDSHKTLPTIAFDEKRIDSVELYPYRALIDKGLSSVMVAHLNVPALEPRDGFPSSLSKHIVTDILKDSLNFKGLIYTDALEMKGVSNYSEPGDIDLAAFQAGNDVLLISEDVPKAIGKIIDAYNSGDISEERLAHSVKKILQAKYKVGLNNFKPIETEHLVEDLNRIQDVMLSEVIFENAITVIKNKEDLLPIRKLEEKKIAYVKMGDDDGSVFLKELKKYTKVHEVASENLDELLIKLSAYNTVIVGFHRSNDHPWKSHEFSDQELTWLFEIARTNNVILDIFVKPYALIDLATVENFESIVVSYQNSEIAQQKSAQLIFGAITSNGALPVSVGNGFNAGDGIHYANLSRLNYGVAERVGMSTEKLNKLDSVAQYAVDKKMTPGIQLLVARKGKVIYNKNFGTHVYGTDSNPVVFDDIYDVASLTKILATLPLLMELEEKKVITLDTKLSTILPEYLNSNKKNITLKKMLSHNARLKPWIPFYYATLDSVTKHPASKYYQKEFSKKFSVKVANELYMRKDYEDTIQKIIRETDLLKKERYRYSDLPYYILKKYIETYYDKGLDVLVQEHFYESLGANYTTYNPYNKFSSKKIVPTEIDDYYRYQEIHGYVHDMGAAMQNGVGGHAGIFSNANDVAKLMQLYLQKGYYGGKRYFKPETIDTFNTCYFCESDNRRGIGFDKPQLGDAGPTCGCISMTSFGHSGFTGTYAWADPEEEIVYIFLANRTYPKADSNLLLKENIRTDIQRMIYEAIID
ncbi:glycoside hydrolase family 3 N-terminal domain-containing protein [Xanthomarina spongicola]|uniref:beta-N-acetylhexosaminidase n=1 Tax=Xanthomarina spongicola TaxID=570520 RepID=A0A316DP74_9FLAO|nr:glycoside hydrolase family 3 N-terminal domain-containing protein [Xanthomarina spongicola]PWK19824.1 beta-glucosidase-like glycosyl hydrolase [Xanthomarina spongicola]